MIDKFTYPKYTSEVYSYSKHPDKWEIPFLLEHVFDLSIGDYIKNPNQCCYYSPVSDVSCYTVESSDEGVAGILDDMICGNGRGSCDLIFNHNGKTFKVKVIVYIDRFNFKLKKNTLFLELGNMISIENMLKHIHCPHYNNCLLEADKLLVKDRELLWEINQLKNKINDYRNIIENYRNGDLIYHNDFDRYYDIQIHEYYDKNGKKHYNYTANVKEGFISHIKSEIKSLTFELRSLIREL